MRYLELLESIKYDFDDVETPEEIAQILHNLDARIVNFPRTNQPHIYIVGDEVIEWDGKDIYTDVTAITQWIWDADVDSYYPDYAKIFNRNFWKSPIPLYHATTEENVEQILQQGLMQHNKTRGIGNRSVGSVIFTTSNYEEALGGSYGNFIFEIDTAAMAADGYRPYVEQEPPVVENELRSSLAHYIGLEDFDPDAESGMSDETVIVYGAIKPKYLKLED